MPRNSSNQGKHNRKVKQLADKFQQLGYDVSADVPGFSKPKTFGGYRPDVIAKKGTQRKIIEVETKDSVNSSRDLKQQSAFKKVAKQSKNTTFQREVI